MASWGVAIGVGMEAIVGFESLKLLLRLDAKPAVSDAIGKIGVVVLVVALLGEIKTGREIHDANARVTQVLLSELDRVVGKNRELDTALRHQGMEITAADTRLNGISGRADDLQETLNGLNDDLDDLKAAQFTLGRKQYESEKRLEAQSGKLDNADKRITTATGKLDALWMKTRSRTIVDEKCLLDRLAKKPHLSADVAYTRDDSEAYTFALQVVVTLRKAGWDVATQRPLTEADALPRIPGDVPHDAPLEMRAGAWFGGLALIVPKIVESELMDSPSNGPIGTLSWALLECAHEGGQEVADPRLPSDKVRIVITRKSARQPL